MANLLLLTALLFGSWVVLSGFFSPFFLMLGIISCLSSVAIFWRMYHTKQSYPFFGYLLVRLPLYGLWLFKEIFISSLVVALNMWRFNLKIDPGARWVKTKQTNAIGLATYANSITLTPGTVSVFVEKDQLFVHALQTSGLDELEEGSMDRLVVKTIGDIQEQEVTT